MFTFLEQKFRLIANKFETCLHRHKTYTLKHFAHAQNIANIDYAATFGRSNPIPLKSLDGTCPQIYYTYGNVRCRSEWLIGQWNDVSGKTIEIFRKIGSRICFRLRTGNEKTFDKNVDYNQYQLLLVCSKNKSAMSKIEKMLYVVSFNLMNLNKNKKHSYKFGRSPYFSVDIDLHISENFQIVI